MALSSTSRTRRLGLGLAPGFGSGFKLGVGPGVAKMGKLADPVFLGCWEERGREIPGGGGGEGGEGGGSGVEASVGARADGFGPNLLTISSAPPVPSTRVSLRLRLSCAAPWRRSVRYVTWGRYCGIGCEVSDRLIGRLVSPLSKRLCVSRSSLASLRGPHLTKLDDGLLEWSRKLKLSELTVARSLVRPS